MKHSRDTLISISCPCTTFPHARLLISLFFLSNCQICEELFFRSISCILKVFSFFIRHFQSHTPPPITQTVRTKKALYGRKRQEGVGTHSCTCCCQGVCFTSLYWYRHFDNCCASFSQMPCFAKCQVKQLFIFLMYYALNYFPEGAYGRRWHI